MGHYSDCYEGERRAEALHKAKRWTPAVVKLERAIKQFYQETGLGQLSKEYKKRIVRERLDEALLWAKDRRCYDPEVLSVMEQLAEIKE